MLTENAGCGDGIWIPEENKNSHTAGVASVLRAQQTLHSNGMLIPHLLL